MKAGKYDPRNNDSNYASSQYMDGDDQQMDQQMFDDEDVPPRFAVLGFEGGEWEMFVSEFPDYDPDRLVQQYLEISRSEPFNTNWNTEQQAASAGYSISDRLTKHDIAKDVLDLYLRLSDTPAVESNEMIVEQGGKRKRRNKNKTKKYKKSKKSRKTKKRRTSRQRLLKKY